MVKSTNHLIEIIHASTNYYNLIRHHDPLIVNRSILIYLESNKINTQGSDFDQSINFFNHISDHYTYFIPNQDSIKN